MRIRHGLVEEEIRAAVDDMRDAAAEFFADFVEAREAALVFNGIMQQRRDDFVFAGSLAEAIAAARAAAGQKQVHVMGGADLIRQALAAGPVDELTIIIAPVTLGAGKRLFDGFGESLELEHLGVRQSPFATFIDYRVRK